MLFDPYRYLELIEEDKSNPEMRGVEGPPRAIRAIRAIPPDPGEPASLYQGASHDMDDNSGMRPSEGSGGAIRAIRAIPVEPSGAISTFSTADSLAPDLAALLALLRASGPMSYGAAASALGWGATRAWQAEAALRAAGRIQHDSFGRAAAIPSPEENQ